jgi:mono/diheme cytochrome c family protein
MRARAGLALLVLAGCRQDMHDQPRVRLYRPSAFFADGRSARPAVEGTVARGQLHADVHLARGKVGATFVDSFPFPVTEGVLRRGRERYQIFCTPCHGPLGQGNGMVVQRGFRKPQSFHIDRLREEKVGYFFDVITNGFGAMPDYAAPLEPADRWAVVAWLRVLQLSQAAPLSELDAEQRRHLAPAASAPAGEEPHRP